MTKMYRPAHKINLQLFAETPADGDGVETVINANIVDEFEPDEEEEESQEGTPEEEEQELSGDIIEDEPIQKPGQDKITKALITAKKGNKEKDRLINELRAELDAIKRQNQQNQQENRRQQIAKSYVDKGFDEDEANRQATNDIRIEGLEKQLKQDRYERQAERLQDRFPTIFDNLDRLVELAEKTGWTLEKVARAELDEVSGYDIKTRAEQEAVLRRQKAETKQTPAGAPPANKTPVKLSAQDERVYQMMVRSGKKISREEFAALANE